MPSVPVDIHSSDMSQLQCPDAVACFADCVPVEEAAALKCALHTSVGVNDGFANPIFVDPRKKTKKKLFRWVRVAVPKTLWPACRLITH